jgi:hypothetical protein
MFSVTVIYAQGSDSEDVEVATYALENDSAVTI